VDLGPRRGPNPGRLAPQGGNSRETGFLPQASRGYRSRDVETFGRYELMKKLAAGGMGQVYLARQKGPVGFQKLLVLKRLLPHLSEDDDFIQMFLDEARIAALLNHPNIAQIYDLGEVDGIYYIAMEYVHGEAISEVNKRAIQRRGAMPVALKCRVISDAAAGLDAAHHARSPSGRKLALIHRDVSPQNVLVGFNGNVKIIDFGVAKAAGKLSQTTAGQIKGKHAYMSPEQAKGEPLDHRSDVFGLGTVFYELLTNTRLFKRESEMATLKAVVGAKIPPPSEVVPSIPKALDAVVLKALARNRDERFSTAGDMQLAIEDFLFKQQQPSTTAHLAAFMRDIYAAELEEEFSTEPTIIAYDPRLPARKPPAPIVDEAAPTALVPVHREKVPPPEVPAAPRAPGVSPIPKAPRVTPAPKAPSDAAARDAAARKTSRGGKGDK
jgi:eukaryotic-like serine/threonine-protein kinase